MLIRLAWADGCEDLVEQHSPSFRFVEEIPRGPIFHRGFCVRGADKESRSEAVFRLQLQARTLAFAAVAAQPHVKEPGGTRLRVVNPRFVADRVGKVVLEGRAEEALPVACRV